MAGKLFASAFMLLVLAAAGCNATGATPSPAPATQAPATQAATFGPSITTPVALRGTWTADISGTTASSGPWIMEITESNVLLQNPVGGEPFTIDPTSLSETALEVAAVSDCPDQSVVTPGTYTLALDGDTLTITVISDSCGDRSGVLASVPWTRKP